MVGNLGRRVPSVLHVIDLAAKGLSLQRSSEPQVRVLFSGLDSFCCCERRSSVQYELNLIGYGSMLKLPPLLLLVFGSFREVLLALLAIVVGLFEALAAERWLFFRSCTFWRSPSASA